MKDALGVVAILEAEAAGLKLVERQGTGRSERFFCLVCWGGTDNGLGGG